MPKNVNWLAMADTASSKPYRLRTLYLLQSMLVDVFNGVYSFKFQEGILTLTLKTYFLKILIIFLKIGSFQKEGFWGVRGGGS